MVQRRISGKDPANHFAGVGADGICPADDTDIIPFGLLEPVLHILRMCGVFIVHVFRKAIVGGYPPSLDINLHAAASHFQEVSFSFRGYANSKRIVFTDQVLIHYRVREDSVILNMDEDTIWHFSEEMLRLFNEQEGIYRDLADFLTFVHLGLSMGLQAADNPTINLGGYLKKMRKYFKTNYNWFRDNRFLKLSSLLKRGFKGIAIWGALFTYKMGLFRLILGLYRTIGLNIKF